MSARISDIGWLLAFASSIALLQDLVEEFAVGERGQRIGQALGADDLEIFLQLVDFLFRRRQPRFELLVGVLHLLGGLHEAFHDRAQAVAVLGVAELLGDAGEAFGVARRGADGGVDHRHDLLDLVHDARTDIVDPVGDAARRQIGVVDLLDVGIGEGAVPLTASR